MKRRRYTLGHQPGSEVRNNVCHHVSSYNYGGWGYYPDEGSRDELFASNIAFDVKCAGHHQHYGTDNRVAPRLWRTCMRGIRPQCPISMS